MPTAHGSYENVSLVELAVDYLRSRHASRPSPSSTAMIIHSNTLNFVETIERYLAALQGGQFDGLLSLFDPAAIVRSPLLGGVPAQDFFPRLSEASASSRLLEPEVFVSGAGSRRAIVSFTYDWTLKNGAAVTFPCCDIFDFALDGRIDALTIVYDAEPVRRAIVDGLR